MKKLSNEEKRDALMAQIEEIAEGISENCSYITGEANAHDDKTIKVYDNNITEIAVAATTLKKLLRELINL